MAAGPFRTYSGPVVPEAPIASDESGHWVTGEGWFVLNARDARWQASQGRGARLSFEGDAEFAQLGINLCVVAPGEPIGMYHWEADQEGFLVVAGEAILLIEEQERRLRQWDFVHCPPKASHMIVGAGEGPCVILAMGAREHQDEPAWGGYPVSELARRYGAGVSEETSDPDKAYADFEDRRAVAYRKGWLGD